MNHNKHEYIEKIKTNESIVNNLGDKFQIFILLFLLVIFIHSTNFFQNFAKVLKSNDAKRIEVVYGFCSPKGVGYINYLKKKYRFQSNPNLLHNPFYPRLNWTFFDFNKRNISTNELILVGYQGHEFKKTFAQSGNNQFKVKKIYNVKKIIGVEFLGEFTNLENNKVSFGLKFSNKGKTIDKRGTFDVTISDKAINYFSVDFDDIQNEDINYLQLNFLSNQKFVDKINNVNVYFENKIDVSNYQIIDNFEDCYYLKKDV